MRHLSTLHKERDMIHLYHLMILFQLKKQQTLLMKISTSYSNLSSKEMQDSQRKSLFLILAMKKHLSNRSINFTSIGTTLIHGEIFLSTMSMTLRRLKIAMSVVTWKRKTKRLGINIPKEKEQDLLNLWRLLTNLILELKSKNSWKNKRSKERNRKREKRRRKLGWRLKRSKDKRNLKSSKRLKDNKRKRGELKRKRKMLSGKERS